jgi:hypothetical protein
MLPNLQALKCGILPISIAIWTEKPYRSHHIYQYWVTLFQLHLCELRQSPFTAASSGPAVGVSWDWVPFAAASSGPAVARGLLALRHQIFLHILETLPLDGRHTVLWHTRVPHHTGQLSSRTAPVSWLTFQFLPDWRNGSPPQDTKAVACLPALSVVCTATGPRQRSVTWFLVSFGPSIRFYRFLPDFKWGYTFGGMMLWLLLVTPPLPESDSWLSRSIFHSVSLSHTSRVPIQGTPSRDVSNRDLRAKQHSDTPMTPYLGAFITAL